MRDRMNLFTKKTNIGVAAVLSICLTLSAMFVTPLHALAAEPQVTAQSAILMDKDSGRILYQKDIEKKMFPASTTKLITALVALDYFDPAALVTVGSEINTVPYDSSKAGHEKGETLTMENLIRGLMIPSGNDSATVVAAAVAKKVEGNNDLPYDECEKKFSELMNEKAKEIGATNTNFTNPHGYHDENHYTTAKDMALIASAAMDNETIRKIAAEKSFDGNGAGENLENDTTIISQNYHWTSHNLLITDSEYAYEYATGIKTGFTDEAGDCLAASAEKDGVQLIAVIFNAEDPNRWIDAKNLFEYGFNTYHMVSLTDLTAPVDTVELSGHNRLEGDSLDIIIKSDIKSFLSTEEEKEVTKTITYQQGLIAENKDEQDQTLRLKAPILKDQEVGSITYQLGDEFLGETKLYASRDVTERTFMSSVKFFFKDFTSNLFTLRGGIIAVAMIAAIVLLFSLIMLIRKKRRRRYKYKYHKRRRY